MPDKSSLTSTVLRNALTPCRSPFLPSGLDSVEFFLAYLHHLALARVDFRGTVGTRVAAQHISLSVNTALEAGPSRPASGLNLLVTEKSVVSCALRPVRTLRSLPETDVQTLAALGSPCEPAGELLRPASKRAIRRNLGQRRIQSVDAARAARHLGPALCRGQNPGDGPMRPETRERLCSCPPICGKQRCLGGL